MCGIAGIVYRDRDRRVPAAVVRSMCDSLGHRGPDDEGLYVQGNVGLGMRRLSVIDLEGGQQPVFSEDGSKVLVFNGELYNYRELREQLRGRGHRLASRGDTETLVHLYEELGANAVHALRGMFAFAIWDERLRTLCLACDRFGMKPLYVVTGPWGLAFASELKALHAVGLTGTDLDWAALDIYFQLGYIPAPATPFQTVRKLQPGHLQLWSETGPTTSHRYWDLPEHGETRSGGRVEERVRSWLDESATTHLVSDVPVAVFLSGGLDSSAVASSMALAGHRPHAYTVRYRGSGAEASDETRLARLLADRYQMRHTVVDVEPNLRDLLEPIVHALDEPHADESAIPTWLISEAVAADYKVALAGTGGDELFAGYRRHIGLLLSELYGQLPAAARHLARSLAHMIPEPAGPGLGVHRLKRFLRGGPGTLAERYLDLQNRFPVERSSFYTPDLARALEEDDAGRRHFNWLWEGAGRPAGLLGALYLDYKTYLPGDLLHLGDRISMAHSLELRMPFVDHELVRQAFPLPARLKIGPLQNKRLLKRALRPRLPRAHFRAPKRGFVGPTATWLRNELKEPLLDELSPARMARLGFFEPEGVERLLDDHFSRRHNHEGILWALLCFSTWHRCFVESPARTEAAGRAPVIRTARQRIGG